MSAKKIVAGLVVAGMFVVLELVGFWFLALPAQSVGVALFLFVGVGGLAMLELQTQRDLQRRYWQRPCTGASWKRKFPGSSKIEIREFLTAFVDAFAFSHKRRCCFYPDDKLMDVYSTLYRLKCGPDAMELEDFCKSLENRYAFNLEPSTPGFAFSTGKPLNDSGRQTNSSYILIRAQLRNAGTQPFLYSPQYSCQILTTDGWANLEYAHNTTLEHMLELDQEVPVVICLPPSVQTWRLKLDCGNVIPTNSVLARVFGNGWWRVLPSPRFYMIPSDQTWTRIRSESFKVELRPKEKHDAANHSPWHSK